MQQVHAKTNELVLGIFHNQSEVETHSTYRFLALIKYRLKMLQIDASHPMEYFYSATVFLQLFKFI